MVIMMQRISVFQFEYEGNRKKRLVSIQLEYNYVEFSHAFIDKIYWRNGK